MSIEFKLNAANVSVDVDPQTTLLEVLRNDFELNAPKFGCGLGQCGACAVLLDGHPVRTCVMEIGGIAGREVTTLEGLGSPETPHPLQQAFMDEQALQCGYCTSGIIMTAAAFLKNNPSPGDDEIKTALNGHLCRCGAHPRIVRAVARAAKSSS